jgi:hypothetical protein
LTIRSTEIPDAEAFKQLFHDAMLQVRGAMPCIVREVNASTASVSIEPAIRLMVTEVDGSKTFRNLPLLNDVPLSFPGSTSLDLFLSIPLVAGDSGLMICCDRSIDNWQYHSGIQNPVETTIPRTYNLRDAVFIPGLRSRQNGIDNYNSELIELRNGNRSVFVGVGVDSIDITASGAVNVTGSPVTINGIVFDTHVHPETGGAFTGPPENP